MERSCEACSKRGFSKEAARAEGKPLIEGILNSLKQGGSRRRSRRESSSGAFESEALMAGANVFSLLNFLRRSSMREGG